MKGFEMKRLYYYFLFFLLFGLIGCVGKPLVTITDNIGRMSPSPSYNLQDVNGKIQAVFWYTSYKIVKDVDGSNVTVPVFLSKDGPNRLDLSKYDRVTMQVEIHNPRKITYHFMESLRYKDTKGRLRAVGGPKSMSNLPYRIYQINIPLNPEIDRGKYGITVSDNEGTPLVHLGDFNYTVIKKGGVSSE
jgi:hypothetical protein